MKKLRQSFTNPWIIGTGTAIIANVIGPIIYAHIENIEILRAFTQIWGKILMSIKQGIVGVITLEVPLWIILIVIVGVIGVRVIGMKFKGDASLKEDFLENTEEVYKQWLFTWKYTKRSEGYFINGDTFRPICKCRCELVNKQSKVEGEYIISSANGYLYCPNCQQYYDRPTSEDIEEAVRVITWRIQNNKRELVVDNNK